MFEPHDDDHGSSDGDSDCGEDFPPRPQYQDPCYRCKKRVYPVERVDVGVLFHRWDLCNTIYFYTVSVDHPLPLHVLFIQGSRPGFGELKCLERLIQLVTDGDSLCMQESERILQLFRVFLLLKDLTIFCIVYLISAPPPP